MAPADNDFFAGYIEEVQAYIPVMKKGLEELLANPENIDILKELYRLTHIIKGASSMVGVTGLSRIAGCMESALEAIQEGQLALATEAFAAMQATVDRFDQYCRALQQGLLVDEQTLLDQTEADFSKIGPGSGAVLASDRDMEQLLFEGESAFPVDTAAGMPDAELLGEFRAEAEEHLEELHLSMRDLEALVIGTAPVTGEIRETIRTIRRSVHTLKGASAVIGLNDIAAYGHLIEDVLDWLYESAASINAAMVPLLAESLDLLAALIHAPADFDEPRAEELLARLHQYMEEGRQGTHRTDAATPEVKDPLSEAILEALETPVAAKETGEGRPEGSLQGSLFSEEEKQLLREGFLEEADEHFQQLHSSLRLLETEVDARVVITPGHKEEIRKIRRAVHTIKGASAVIGLNEISVYAHGVEDFLDWLYEGASRLDPVMVAALVESLDLLGLLVESSESVTMERQGAVLQRLIDLSRERVPEEPVVFEEPVFEEEPDLPDASEQPWPEGVDEKSEAEVSRQTPLTEPAKTIRINQGQLDGLVNLSNELLVGVSGFDRNMGSFKTALEELELTSRRLKDIALELETKFEVKALDRLSRHFAHIDRSLADIKTNQSFSEFDDLELDRYTQLNLIIRSLNESAIDVAAIHANMGGIYSGIGGDISRQHRVIRELQMQIMRTRMSPMSTLSSRLGRTMRDVASRLGKRVQLVVEGGRIELDRVVWEKLADLFMHLMRNAIHHGIETEEERLVRNKPAMATITLAGRREGNNIVIRFSDDGQGLDFETIREKARRFGLGDKVDQMDEGQLTDLIFYPGFSTKTISDISGRGVGMDVVKEIIRALQGSLTVETRRGKGTSFIMRLPLTLGVVRALLVKINEVTYGIALNDIQGIHRLESSDISVEDGTCMLGGATTPIYSLSHLLGLMEGESMDAKPLVLAISREGRTVALAIPHITGQKEIVIKGLGTHLQTVAGVSGAAVMGDGSIVPVLNIPDLIQAAAHHLEQRDPSPFVLDIPSSFTVMIVDDSISIRRVMSRLVSANGWVPIEAKDGLDAVEQLEIEGVRPDCIVLDIEMPRMNGFEFLAKLSNIPEGKTIPVIMLTSRTSSKHQEKAYQLGAGAFLSKPCKDEEFVETVRRLTSTLPPSSQESRQEVLS